MKAGMKDESLYQVTPFATFAGMLEICCDRYPRKLALEDLTSTPLPRLTHAELRAAALPWCQTKRPWRFRELERVCLTHPGSRPFVIA